MSATLNIPVLAESSDRFIHSGGKMYHFDPPERLMDGRSVQQISKIMDLPRESLNNLKPIEPPQYARAVQVARYREEGTHHQISHNKTKPFEDDKDFVPKTAEVMVRAAWAWARSADLCDECAAKLQQTGPDTMALNLKNEKDRCAVLERAINTLHRRAKLAREHAECLRLEAGSNDISKWTQSRMGLSEVDVEYYMRLGYRYEGFQRANVAALYQLAARDFVLEALYTFVDAVLEKEGPTNITANQYVRNLWRDNNVYSAYQKVGFLWARACRWLIQIGRGRIALNGDIRQRRF